MNTDISAPIDFEPSPNGNVVVTGGGATGLYQVIPKGLFEKFDERFEGLAVTRHTSHFATCPNAKQHRKKK